MTALSLERIGELRDRILGRESWPFGSGRNLTHQDFADLLALLDKEAAQLKDAKAPSLDLSPEDERALELVNEAAHYGYDHEDQKWWEEVKAALAHLRSRLAGVRVTREQVKKLVDAISKRQDPVSYVCDELRSLGVCVGGDE